MRESAWGPMNDLIVIGLPAPEAMPERPDMALDCSKRRNGAKPAKGSEPQTDRRAKLASLAKQRPRMWASLRRAAACIPAFARGMSSSKHMVVNRKRMTMGRAYRGLYGLKHIKFGNIVSFAHNV